MGRRTTRLAGTALAVAAATALAACGGSTGSSGSAAEETDEAGLRVVQVGAVPVVDVAALYLGQDQGFFADRGLTIEVTFGQGGAALIPAVLNGEFDVAYSNAVSLLQARDQGLPVVAVAEGGASTGVQGEDHGGIYVLPDSPVQGPADLVGHSVGVNSLGSLHELATRASVEKAGGDPDQVTFVELPLPDMNAALAAGDIDAAATSEPFTSQLRGAGDRLVASQFVDTDPDFVTALYVTTEQRVAEDPELVADFRAAMNESLDYAAEHADEVRAELPEYTQIDPALIPSMVLTRFASDLPRAPIERLAELASAQGVLENPADETVDGLLSYVEGQ